MTLSVISDDRRPVDCEGFGPPCHFVRAYGQQRWPLAGLIPSARETAVMLCNGKVHLESLREGRVVYLGNEEVDDA